MRRRKRCKLSSKFKECRTRCRWEAPRMPGLVWWDAAAANHKSWKASKNDFAQEFCQLVIAETRAVTSRSPSIFGKCRGREPSSM